jgi:hypothetical protein
MDFLLQAIRLSKNETVRSLIDVFDNGIAIDYNKFCQFYKNKTYVTITINKQQKTVKWDEVYYGGIDASTY